MKKEVYLCDVCFHEMEDVTKMTDNELIEHLNYPFQVVYEKSNGEKSLRMREIDICRHCRDRALTGCYLVETGGRFGFQK